MPTAARTTARVTETRPRHNGISSTAGLSKTHRADVAAAGLPRFLQRKPAAGQAGDRLEQADNSVANTGSVPRFLQAKLAISQPGDVYEQEADRVAEQVIRMPQSAVQEYDAGQGVKIHRKADAESAAGTVPSSASGVAHMPHGVDSLQGSGHVLPNAAHQFFASRMGADFSDVKIHRDNQAAQLSTDLHARAFTYGNHVAFAPGEYDTDTSTGKQLLAHELTHVLQQRGQSGRMVQRDLALRPRTKDIGTGPTLSSEEQKAAIAYNKLRFKGMPDKVMRTTEDIVGKPRDAVTIDDVFVTAIARWQSWWNLPADGRMTPMTAHAFASELRAEAQNVRRWQPTSDLSQRLDESARYFDEMGAGQFREGAAPATPSAGAWTPPSGVDKLRGEISQELQADPAAAAPIWRDRAYAVRSSSTLGEDDRSEYLAEISAQLSGKGTMAQAMEVLSLIDVVSESARTQMGSALSRVAANAATDETTARDYLKMLLRLTGIASKDVPADPKAWLENNTEAVGQAIRALERVLGSEISRQLTGSVLKASFSKDMKFTVDPSGAGHITNLPKDPAAGKRLLADCDVYAVYGMRLLRAQGWETVGYFTFQGETQADTAHAIGLARRKTDDNKTEYVVIDSMKSSFIVSLGNMSSDEAAKVKADESVSSWDYHFFAPPVGGGAIDARLNTLHPMALKYPPGSP